MGFRWDLVAPPVPVLTPPVRVDVAGLAGPTKPQSRGPRWQRTSAGLFVPASVTDDLVEQRVLEAFSRCGDRAVVTGWAALRLHGAGWFDGLGDDGRTRLPVPIAANGERVETGAGLLVSRFVVPPDEQVMVHGMRCASVERALYDEMRRVGAAVRMVIAADMTFAAGLTSIARMRQYTLVRRWYRDRRIVDAALALCDEHARSGPEVAFRLIWELQATWGHPICNREVLDEDGRLVAIPDLICPRRGVVGEYAGAYHRDIDQHGRDIGREAALRAVGLEYVEVVGRDLRTPAVVVRRMEQAATRAAAYTLPRRWQLGPPPRPSLDEYLTLRAAVVE